MSARWGGGGPSTGIGAPAGRHDMPAGPPARPSAVIDDELLAALGHSRFAGLGATALERMLVGSMRLDLAAGQTGARPSDRPTVSILVRGLLRLYMASPQGRQVTLRYARPGSLLGVATLFSEVPVVLVQEALVDSRLLVLRADVVRALAERDHDVALAMLREASDRVQTYIVVAGGNVFASVRQRVAGHLLETAEVASGSDLLVADLEQQQLADAAGTVREVVVRVLRQFRDEGLVRTGREGIVLVDPVRLEAVTRSATEP